MGTIWIVVYLQAPFSPCCPQVLLELETSAVVLTCIPAAVDPLIYTMVTRQFRSEFRKLLSSAPGCPLQWRD